MICVSRYENIRAWSSGSSVGSMPGTKLPAQNATCSVSAKKLAGLRSRVSVPTRCTGHNSSGTIFVGSSRSMPWKNWSSLSGMTCTPRSHCGYAPASIEFQRSRRWKSGSMPPSFCDSSHTSECTPAAGFQWNFTRLVLPLALTSRNVWTPKPSMVRKARGIARSDIAHISMWVDSGVSDTKSQNESWAVCACGISRSGSGFAAWITSGNLMPSWMKNTGMLLPTRSKLPCCV